PGEDLVTTLRGVLPQEVVVRRARAVPGAVDARFSATGRRYTYRICDDPPGLDPLRRRDTVVWRRGRDVGARDAAAGGLVGLQDFAAYCRPREGASTVRQLQTYTWTREADGTLRATLVADAFCHSMVRALVGGVVPVGEGRRDRSWPKEVLGRKVRDAGVQVMPAHGLCLEEIDYPATEEGLAARATASRAVRGPLHRPVQDAR
ncbi:MAG TPA: tRNA pseudouridine(38-40) synthase TruA, partial [Ornithinimicrobium sp.]|nr:tRNA pseudouridine(38-40) synthase TruA [Ornithinimicrobium sp.]